MSKVFSVLGLNVPFVMQRAGDASTTMQFQAMTDNLGDTVYAVSGNEIGTLYYDSFEEAWAALGQEVMGMELPLKEPENAEVS